MREENIERDELLEHEDKKHAIIKGGTTPVGDISHLPRDCLGVRHRRPEIQFRAWTVFGQ